MTTALQLLKDETTRATVGAPLDRKLGPCEPRMRTRLTLDWRRNFMGTCTRTLPSMTSRKRTSA